MEKQYQEDNNKTIHKEFSNDLYSELNNFEKNIIEVPGKELDKMYDKEPIMGNIKINNIKNFEDEKLEFNEKLLFPPKPEPIKKYGISLYGNVWCIGDAEKLDREITCNDNSLTYHYDIAEVPVLEEGQVIETSDHFSNERIISAPIVKVVELTESQYLKLKEALKSIHEAYGAVKITQDPINGELNIEGFTKNGYEIVGHISTRGTVKEYEIQPDTPYKKNKEILDAAASSVVSMLAEERKASDDDRTKAFCEILDRLPMIGEPTWVTDKKFDDIIK